MNRSDQFPEVKEIADAVCAENVTQEQLTRLEQLLHGDFAAKAFYYDYLNMHIQLKQPADRNMEFVYRRMTEEFVMRPRDSALDAELDPSKVIEPPATKKHITMLAFIALLLIALFWLLVTQNSSNHHVAKLVAGHLNIIGRQGKLEGDSIFPGVYLSNEKTTIKLIDGDTIELGAKSRIKLYNNNEVRTVYGKFTFISSPGQNTIIHNKDFIVNTQGSDLTLTFSRYAPQLISGESTRLNPLLGRPVHYWSFESKSERIIDLAAKAFGVAGANATRVSGKVGQAIHFDNTAKAYIDLGSGGGTALGTGSFSVSDGITIEALIKPQFSEALATQAEIFSQVHGDNDVRISLGFHSPKASDSEESSAPLHLHFGLFILGLGYQELTMPIDGQNGRPSLAQLEDGNFHHIAATYKAQTGLKTLYLNGQKLATAQYPQGLKALSGGSGSAVIGNRLVANAPDNYAFSGAIDEVAFYNFAIPEYTLMMHGENSRQGKNYWGEVASEKKLLERIPLILPANKVIELDKETKLPSKIINN